MNTVIPGGSRAIATAGWPILPSAAIKGPRLVLAPRAALLVLRRASAALRHLIWMLAVGGTLALPALSAPADLVLAELGAGESGAQPAEPAKNAKGSLAGWLEDKEVVEVSFVGVRMDLQELLRSVKSAASPTDDFRVTPGEGGGTGGAFLSIEMKVGKETTKRLLAVQDELAPRGYLLDPSRSVIWSYKPDRKLREQSRKLVPEIASAVEKAIKAKYPMAEVAYEKEPEAHGNLVALTYKVPGTNASGLFRISETTQANQMWVIAIGPDQQHHLPHLGLMVHTYYRDGQFEDSSPEHMAVRSAIEESLAPLVKLEPGAANKPDAQPSTRAAPTADK